LKNGIIISGLADIPETEITLVLSASPAFKGIETYE
jgi:hypothetical protein